MTSRSKAPLILLGLFTAIQAGTGLWRVIVMLQEAMNVGPTPFALTAGLAEELALSALLALVAWWWLPPGERSSARWAVHFLVFAWLLAIAHLLWVLGTGFFERAITWPVLGILLLSGTAVRRRGVQGGQAQPEAPSTDRRWHPAIAGAVFFWLLQLPHLFFPYHYTDTREIWACRAVGFDLRGDLTGIFDCLDPGRPPLHSILLWLGHSNGTIEGRLLPFLMVGAFGFLVYHLLSRIAPRLAPWGLLWFFMTVRVYQGSVTNYADVATMIAIAVTVALAVDAGSLVRSRWMGVAFAIVAALAASLIKRDGGALVLVATAVVLWLASRRREPRLYAPLVGAALGFLIWSARPANLYVPSVFAPRSSIDQPARPPALSSPGGMMVVTVAQVDAPIADTTMVDSTRATLQTYVTMLHGMQGQVLSHYGFGLFVPCWVILAVWFALRQGRLSPEARLWGWIGLLGWLAIVGIYFVHVSTGHPYRGSLLVIRTAFGRHLVHMFLFALLNATALAEGLIFGGAHRMEPTG